MSFINFRSVQALSATLAVALLISTGARGDQDDIAISFGKAEFQKRCEVCHGPVGKGDGALADLLTTAPPDLTKISQRNNGKFPALDIYQTIDGRRGLRAHGTQDMPIWGDYYKSDAAEQGVSENKNYEEYVHGRILSLVFFLQSIQVE